MKNEVCTLVISSLSNEQHAPVALRHLSGVGHPGGVFAPHLSRLHIGQLAQDTADIKRMGGGGVETSHCQELTRSTSLGIATPSGRVAPKMTPVSIVIGCISLLTTERCTHSSAAPVNIVRTYVSTNTSVKSVKNCFRYYTVQ